jgi:hypothetical protein
VIYSRSGGYQGVSFAIPIEVSHAGAAADLVATARSARAPGRGGAGSEPEPPTWFTDKPGGASMVEKAAS